MCYILRSLLPRLLLIMILALMATVLPASRVSAAEVIWEKYEVGTKGALYMDVPAFLGQSFTAIGAHNVTAVELYIEPQKLVDCLELNEGWMSVSIREAGCNDKPIGSDLLGPVSTNLYLNTTPHWEKFDFGDSIQVVPGHKYVIVIELDACAITYLYRDSNDGYKLGRQLKYNESTSTWDYFGHDLMFRVYGDDTDNTIYDFGDAPDDTDDDYKTLLASDGARHAIDPDLYLGSSVDEEADGQPNDTATGDDGDSNDDEDGITFTTPLVPGQECYFNAKVDSDVYPVYLSGWVDFDGNGTFDPGYETIMGQWAQSSSLKTWSFSVPYWYEFRGSTFARFRLTPCYSWDFCGPAGLAYGGEVEDYQVEILELDLGDAPDDWTDYFYETVLSNVGACHILGSGLYLGSGVDSDTDGQPNDTATGDDNDGNNDDDGVVFTSPIIPGEDCTVDITASGSGFLNAWVDFAGDGSWYEAEDNIFADEPLTSGLNQLTFTVPETALPGTTFARFRFDSDGIDISFGLAEDGEVEDYQVEIETEELPPSPPPPPLPLTVGGDVYPVNKMSLLLPWFALALTVVAAGILLVRRRVPGSK